MTRGVSYRQAEASLVGGIALLAFAFTLALYSVPSNVPGIPSFPFFSLAFPLLPLLLALGTGLVSWGWIFHPKGSLRQLAIASIALTFVGVILKVWSFLTAVPLDVNGMVILVELFGAQTTMVLVTGPLMGLFGVLYRILERLERRRLARKAASRDE